ncbi:helix-turn-helix domain-containing protein [uncultured Caulobacter sp.]|uniref:AraC-like ligand-binding domain-containing protein n=1 Tax=uncultured Caulobacter sp. TaxID=158749 RepID=UPI0026078157|nr:helix-turn-helix domain-containing protein [uncultured Caulobacter sp.]
MADDRPRRDLWVLDAREHADAAEQYRRSCAHLFDITLLSPEATFHNSMDGYNLGGVVFGLCEGAPQRFDRRLSHVAADASDTVMAVLELRPTGWTADYDGRAASGAMGEIRLVDMARPFSLTIEQPFESLYFVIPRAQLDPQVAGVDFHGRVVAEAAGPGRLLGSHLRTLWEAIGSLTTTDATLAARAGVALMSAVILAHGEPAATDPRPIEKMLLAEGQRYVDQHLDDPDLSPETVRQHLGVSRSLLYKVFEARGGVSAFIQARRLDQTFDVILQDRTEQHTLAEIGYRHGFRSDAHFSRAFRARFGVTPGRLRKLGEAARREGLSALERPDDVWAWFRSL